MLTPDGQDAPSNGTHRRCEQVWHSDQPASLLRMWYAAGGGGSGPDKRTSGHNPLAFQDRYQAVCGLRGILFHGAGRPVHLNIGGTLGAQTKMQAGVVG